MIFREAKTADIPQMHIVRNSVKENVLSEANLISHADYEEYITRRGKGWVCETHNIIIGFAIADLYDSSIWALFIHPEYEGCGIGKRLHDIMLNWYFAQGKKTVWLSTSPSTRAERFYRKAGWKENGTHGKGEIKFEMNTADWNG